MIDAFAVFVITVLTALPVTVVAVVFALRNHSGRDESFFLFFAFITLYDAVVPSMEGVYIFVTSQAIAVPVGVTAFFVLLQTLFLSLAVFFLVRIRGGVKS